MTDDLDRAVDAELTRRARYGDRAEVVARRRPRQKVSPCPGGPDLVVVVRGGVAISVGEHAEAYARALDRLAGVHPVCEAAWRDVQAKDKRIRASGGVTVVSDARGYVVADVRGDTRTYRTTLSRAAGSKGWTCRGWCSPRGT